MTLTIAQAPQALLAAVLGIALLVVPGFTLEWLPRLRVGSVQATYVRAFVASLAYLILTGAVLIAVGRFSAAAMALIGLAGIVGGSIPALRWAGRALRTRRRAVLVAALAVVIGGLAVPWVLSTLEPGMPHSATFEWYYWGLGRQLTDAGGVPAWVVEYGREVRWLPDYLGFTIVSEAYRGIGTWFASDATLLSAWRLVPVVLGLPMVYLVVRRWLGVAASVAAVGAVAATVFFVTKFNVYKPESLGIVVGVAAVWLLIAGIRARAPSAILLAGVAIGLAMSIHAIAATVLAVAMVGIGGAEWLLVRGRRWRVAAWLVLGGLSALVMVGAVGWAIQGRAFVATDALRPALVDGVDPTWIYLNRSIGNFDDPPVPPLSEQLSSSVLRPWPGAYVLDAADWWWYGSLAAGILLAIFLGRRRARMGLLGGALFGAALVAAMLFFALSFETYVPRHTGLARFGQYVPLLFAIGVGFATEGFLAAIGRIGERRVPAIAATVLSMALVLAAAPALVLAQFADDARFGEVGDAALVELQALVQPGDIVMANAVSTGWLEFYLPAEAPLEGRQPLIEDVDLLAYVNELLLDWHRYLTDPEDGDAAAVIDGLGARWLLVSDDPSPLGTRQTYGGTIERFIGDPAYRLAWRSDSVAIFERLSGATPSPPQGPALDLVGQAIVAGALGIAAILLLAVIATAIEGRPVLRLRRRGLDDASGRKSRGSGSGPTDGPSGGSSGAPSDGTAAARGP